MRRDPSVPPLAPRTKNSLLPRKQSLLYVEDDDDNWEVAEYRLSERFDIVRASTSEEACRLVRARHHELELILMDIELRGSDLNGVELTELLRGNSLPADRTVPAYARSLPLWSKPIIYVTAHGKRYTNVRLMLSGAEKVIAKPVNFADLTGVMAELIRQRAFG